MASMEMHAEFESRSTHAQNTLNARPVLVAVDLLPGSDKPVFWACNYAQTVGAPVCIVHAVHEPVSAPGFYNNPRDASTVLEPMDVAAHRMLESLLSDMRNGFPDLSPLQLADHVLVNGLPKTRIGEVANDRDAQLLVIGHRKRTRLQKLLESSTAWQIMQSVSIPVVVIS